MKDNLTIIGTYPMLCIYTAFELFYYHVQYTFLSTFTDWLHHSLSIFTRLQKASIIFKIAIVNLVIDYESLSNINDETSNYRVS